MPVFEISNSSSLSRINGINFDSEKQLQTLVERNIDKIFGLQFVESEVPLLDMRIDTLAFNPESKSFIIIEYKKDKNYSVIDQGFAYLALMLNNKAHFELRYIKKNNSHGSIDINWSQSKVLFVSPFFSLYQRKAIEFQDLPIELWEVKRFENNIIEFNQIKPIEKRESIKTLSQQNKIIDKVSQEIKIYNEEEKIRKFNQNIQDLYYKIRDKVLEIGDDITVSPQQNYIAYKKNAINFALITPKSFGVRVRINTKKFKINDPKSLITFDSYGPKIVLENDAELDYVLDLVRQAYEQTR